MTSPAKAAGKGRRNPSLLTADNEVVEPLAEHVEGQEQEEGELTPGERLVYGGDVQTMSVTLAIDLLGDGHTSFIGYKSTVRVQEDEDFPDVYGRLAQVVNSGILTAVDDTIESLVEYIAERERKQQELNRITGG